MSIETSDNKDQDLSTLVDGVTPHLKSSTFWGLASLGLMIAYLLLALFAKIEGNRLMFVPHRAGYQPSPELITLRNAHHQSFKVYYLAPPKESSKVILFSHGYNTDIADYISFAHQLHELGYGVLLYDYQGFGLSSGKPSEEGCYLDARAAFDFLVKELEIAPQRIVVFGHSLGSAVALDLALHRKVYHVILDSPFVSIFRVTTSLPILPLDRFDNLSKVKNLPARCKLEIRFSQEDRMIPAWHSKKLYEAAVQNRPGAVQQLVERTGRHQDFAKIMQF